MAWLLTWLVQGLAIALIARVAFRALPGLSAATRYTMWWAALVLVLILPIVRGVTADARAGAGVGADARVGVDVGAGVVAGLDPSESMSAAANESAADGLAFGGSSPAGARPAGARPVNANETVAAALRSLPSLPPVSLPRAPDWLVSIAIGLWLGFVMVGLAQIVYSVHAVRRLKESCRRMVAPRESELTMWSAVRERGRAVRVRTSDRVRTAAVLGLTRPIIAVPRDASAALTPHEIDQVVLHEYAHVRRYDDWTKLLQVLIGAFFGWHPAVRLMMREIDFEREAACDDYVVDVTGAPRAYARCLTKVIEMMPGPGLAAVPHVSSSGHRATTRIERLLDRRRPSGRLAVMPAMAGSLTLAALAFCTVHALPIATDHPGQSFALPFGASQASIAGTTTAVTAGDISGGLADGMNVGRISEGGIDAIDARGRLDVPMSGASAANAEIAKLSEVAAVARPADGDAASPREGRRLDLRLAGAGTLPIALPLSRFSPLSRLTDARLPASRAATSTPATPTPASPRDLTPSVTPPAHDASLSTWTNLAQAAPLSTTAGPEARDMAAMHVANDATKYSQAAIGLGQARDNGAASAPRPSARGPHVSAKPGGSSALSSSAASGSAAASVPSGTPGASGMSGKSAPRAEANYALGPVGSAADSDAMPEASESGHIGRAWENTRDATSKAMGVGARALGSATKTAGDATKTATNKAAAGVKVSGEKTARALGRVKRTLASVF